MTFADKAIQFHQQLQYTGGPLPNGIHLLDPYKDQPQVPRIVDSFYHKYFNDHKKRHIIFGINPGRFGAGLTGIPFTDPKRLVSDCGIAYEGKPSHEPSSVFIYEMIKAYGGVKKFYGDLVINSPCPLGFIKEGTNGSVKNYNYYDSPQLAHAIKDFMVQSIKDLVALGLYTDVCFCLGTGQNEKFLSRINSEHHFFNTIVALEHPRYIMQYKSASKQLYIDKYIDAFNQFVSVEKDER